MFFLKINVAPSHFEDFPPLYAPKGETWSVVWMFHSGGKILNFMGGAWCVRKEREGRGKTVWCVCCEFKAGWVYSVSHSQISPGPCVKALSGNVYPRYPHFNSCLTRCAPKRSIFVYFCCCWGAGTGFGSTLRNFKGLCLGAQKKYEKDARLQTGDEHTGGNRL